MARPLPETKSISRVLVDHTAVALDVCNMIAAYAANYHFHYNTEICQTHSWYGNYIPLPYPHANKAFFKEEDTVWTTLDIDNKARRVRFPGLVDIETTSRDYILADLNGKLALLDPETQRFVFYVHSNCENYWPGAQWTMPCFRNRRLEDTVRILDPRRPATIPMPQNYSDPLICGDFFYMSRLHLPFFAPLRDALMPNCEFSCVFPDITIATKRYRILEEPKHCVSSASIACSDTLVLCIMKDATRSKHWRVSCAAQPSIPIDTYTPLLQFGDIAEEKPFVLGDHVYEIVRGPRPMYTINEML